MKAVRSGARGPHQRLVDAPRVGIGGAGRPLGESGRVVPQLGGRGGEAGDVEPFAEPRGDAVEFGDEGVGVGGVVERQDAVGEEPRQDA